KKKKKKLQEGNMNINNNNKHVEEEHESDPWNESTYKNDEVQRAMQTRCVRTGCAAEYVYYVVHER
ncbi:hypothetical protein G3N96_33320, partial [Burkholderia sp. Se-20373]|uniref:hypothetical protein n=1 Tax=Burkholderia sp. Se-20373 TaxID=2703898 RepID=UPI0019820B82